MACVCLWLARLDLACGGRHASQQVTQPPPGPQRESPARLGFLRRGSTGSIDAPPPSASGESQGSRRPRVGSATDCLSGARLHDHKCAAVLRICQPDATRRTPERAGLPHLRRGHGLAGAERSGGTRRYISADIGVGEEAYKFVSAGCLARSRSRARERSRGAVPTLRAPHTAARRCLAPGLLHPNRVMVARTYSICRF